LPSEFELDFEDQPMFKPKMQFRQLVQIATALIGVTLLVSLIRRTGPSTVIDQIRTVRWGLALVIGLGGISHLTKTLAWRFTFLCDVRNVSFARTFALRLVAETISSFGLPGQVFGETARVYFLGSAMPVAKSISSVTLDRGLYIASSAFVSVAGILIGLFLLPLSRTWQLYAFCLASVLALLVVLTVMAFQRRWPVFSGSAQMLGRLPWFKKWLHGKQSIIDSAEDNLFRFYHDAPKAFCASLILNLACHGMAILEVYILLYFMGASIGLAGAFVLEAFTKLINVIGALNPGNLGTYEAGNMILTRLLGAAGTAGLTLGLCRRVRSLFWKATGFLCLVAMSRSTQEARQILSVSHDAVEVS
jgi:Lysylphosphatidylglycerol synthase TM region